jgi:hypothetical protein
VTVSRSSFDLLNFVQPNLVQSPARPRRGDPGLGFGCLLLLALVGCPEPVAPTAGEPSSVGGSPGGPPPAGEGGAAGADPASAGGVPAKGAAGAPAEGAADAGTAGTPAAGGSAGGGAAVEGAGGVFGGAVPEAERTPKFKQEELSAGATLLGTLVCADCTGKLLVRVLPPPPESGAEAKVAELITSASFDKAGPFELRVPADSGTVVLQVVDDADEDGQPSAGERMGIPTTGPVKVAARVEGIVLEVGVFPAMPPQAAK